MKSSFIARHAGWAVLSIGVIALPSPPVGAAELKVLSISVARNALPDLVAVFEKETGNTVAITYDSILPVASRIDKGESFDAVVLPQDRLESLAKQGKIKAESIASLMHVAIGAGVPPGMAKPDIGSAEALKRALLAAASVTYPDPANGTPSGLYFPPVLDTLGIAAEMKPKIKFAKSGSDAVDVLGKGEAQLGFASIGDFTGKPAQLIGPLPAELKSEIVYSAGVVTSAKEAQPALALVKYITSPAAAAVLKAKGFTP
jgi:molybdate transport system substrate-binding protein